MTDHNLDLSMKRVSDSIQHGNAELQTKKTELQKLEADLKLWEQNLKLGKPKHEMLQKEIHTLEVVQHGKIQELNRMTEQHRKEFLEIQKQGKTPGTKMPSHLNL